MICHWLLTYMSQTIDNIELIFRESEMKLMRETLEAFATDGELLEFPFWQSS